MNFTTKAPAVLSCTRLSGILCMVFTGLFIPYTAWPQTLTNTQQAASHFVLGQYDSARVYYSMAVTQYPGEKEIYYNRGLCYYHLNRFADALHDFDTCLQSDSTYSDAIFMKTLTLQRQNEWEKAFTEFKKLNTNYTGYKELKKLIRYHNLSVILSRNWYYMIAIMFLFIILVGVVAKSYAVRKGY